MTKLVREKVLLTDDVIDILAERAHFTKGDIKTILDEIRVLFEESIESGTDIDIKGLMQVRTMKMEYKKAPGIVAHKGKEDFRRNIKRVVYRVPVNIKDILRKQK